MVMVKDARAMYTFYVEYFITLVLYKQFSESIIFYLIN